MSIGLSIRQLLTQARPQHVSARRAIALQFQAHPVFGLGDLILVATHHSQNSEVFEYRHRGATDRPPLVVKWKNGYGSARSAARVATREFAALEALWKRSGVALDGSIPRPVALLPGLGAFVAEKLPGKNLRTILQLQGNRLVGPFRRKRLSQVAWQIGRWVRRFHDSTLGIPQTHDSPRFLGALCFALRQCCSGGMEPRALAEIVELSARLSERLHGSTVPTAAKHGDLIPMNILVEGDHIAVLDFESFRDFDAIYEDLGTINAYLGLLNLSARYSQRAIGRMIVRFSEGYGELQNKELLPLYTLRAAANIAAWGLEQGEGPRMSARRLRALQEKLLVMARSLLA